MNVTFEEITHTYTVDGTLVDLCVSDVLELAGITGYSDQVPKHFIEHARMIGTAVHKACHYLDCGELDVDTVDPQIAGYVMGYHKFCQQHEPAWELIEEPMADLELGVAGTADRIGIIQGPLSGSPWSAGLSIIDIKTPVKAERHWGLQLSAYALLSKRVDYALYALHLRRDGEFSLLPYKFEPEVFHAALTLARWKKQKAKSQKPRATGKSACATESTATTKTKATPKATAKTKEEIVL